MVKAAHGNINAAQQAQLARQQALREEQAKQVSALSEAFDAVAKQLQTYRDQDVSLQVRVNDIALQEQFAALRDKLAQETLEVGLRFAGATGESAESAYRAQQDISNEGFTRDAALLTFNPDLEAVEVAIQNLTDNPKEVPVKLIEVYQQGSVFSNKPEDKSKADAIITFNPETNELDARLQKLADEPTTHKVLLEYSEVNKPTGFATGGLAAGYASGGSVHGPGTPTSDSILARLSRGEFVQPFRAVKHYGVDFMESIRSLRYDPLAPALAGDVGGSNLDDMRKALGSIAGRSNLRPVVLDFGGKQVKGLYAEANELTELERRIKKARE